MSETPQLHWGSAQRQSTKPTPSRQPQAKFHLPGSHTKNVVAPVQEVRRYIVPAGTSAAAVTEAVARSAAAGVAEGRGLLAPLDVVAAGDASSVAPAPVMMQLHRTPLRSALAAFTPEPRSHGRLSPMRDSRLVSRSATTSPLPLVEAEVNDRRGFPAWSVVESCAIGRPPVHGAHVTEYRLEVPLLPGCSTSDAAIAVPFLPRQSVPLPPLVCVRAEAYDPAYFRRPPAVVATTGELHLWPTDMLGETVVELERAPALTGLAAVDVDADLGTDAGAEVGALLRQEEMQARAVAMAEAAQAARTPSHMRTAATERAMPAVLNAPPRPGDNGAVFIERFRHALQALGPPSLSAATAGASTASSPVAGTHHRYRVVINVVPSHAQARGSADVTPARLISPDERTNEAAPTARSSSPASPSRGHAVPTFCPVIATVAPRFDVARSLVAERESAAASEMSRPLSGREIASTALHALPGAFLAACDADVDELTLRRQHLTAGTASSATASSLDAKLEAMRSALELRVSLPSLLQRAREALHAALLGPDMNAFRQLSESVATLVVQAHGGGVGSTGSGIAVGVVTVADVASAAAPDDTAARVAAAHDLSRCLRVAGHYGDVAAALTAPGAQDPHIQQPHQELCYNVESAGAASQWIGSYTERAVTKLEAAEARFAAGDAAGAYRLLDALVRQGALPADLESRAIKSAALCELAMRRLTPHEFAAITMDGATAGVAEGSYTRQAGALIARETTAVASTSGNVAPVVAVTAPIAAGPGALPHHAPAAAVGEILVGADAARTAVLDALVLGWGADPVAYARDVTAAPCSSSSHDHGAVRRASTILAGGAPNASGGIHRASGLRNGGRVQHVLRPHVATLAARLASVSKSGTGADPCEVTCLELVVAALDWLSGDADAGIMASLSDPTIARGATCRAESLRLALALCVCSDLGDAALDETVRGQLEAHHRSYGPHCPFHALLSMAASWRAAAVVAACQRAVVRVAYEAAAPPDASTLEDDAVDAAAPTAGQALVAALDALEAVARRCVHLPCAGGANDTSDATALDAAFARRWHRATRIETVGVAAAAPLHVYAAEARVAEAAAAVEAFDVLALVRCGGALALPAGSRSAGGDAASYASELDWAVEVLRFWLVRLATTIAASLDGSVAGAQALPCSLRYVARTTAVLARGVVALDAASPGESAAVRADPTREEALETFLCAQRCAVAASLLLHSIGAGIERTPAPGSSGGDASASASAASALAFSAAAASTLRHAAAIFSLAAWTDAATALGERAIRIGDESGLLFLLGPLVRPAWRLRDGSERAEQRRLVQEREGALASRDAGFLFAVLLEAAVGAERCARVSTAAARQLVESNTADSGGATRARAGAGCAAMFDAPLAHCLADVYGADFYTGAAPPAGRAPEGALELFALRRWAAAADMYERAVGAAELLGQAGTVAYATACAGAARCWMHVPGADWGAAATPPDAARSMAAQSHRPGPNGPRSRRNDAVAGARSGGDVVDSLPGNAQTTSGGEPFVPAAQDLVALCPAPAASAFFQVSASARADGPTGQVPPNERAVAIYYAAQAQRACDELSAHRLATALVGEPLLVSEGGGAAVVFAAVRTEVAASARTALYGASAMGDRGGETALRPHEGAHPRLHGLLL